MIVIRTELQEVKGPDRCGDNGRSRARARVEEKQLVEWMMVKLV